MEFDPKRAGIMQRCKIAHLAIVICVALIFLSWFFPYFKYAPYDDKDLKTQNSMWGEIFFNYNFMQLEDYMKEDTAYATSSPYNEERPFKFVSLRQLGAPVICMAHLGGMLFGFLLIRYWQKHPDSSQGFGRSRGQEFFENL